jgi:hypothetical protein
MVLGECLPHSPRANPPSAHLPRQTSRTMGGVEPSQKASHNRPHGPIRIQIPPKSIAVNAEWSFEFQVSSFKTGGLLETGNWKLETHCPPSPCHCVSLSAVSWRAWWFNPLAAFTARPIGRLAFPVSPPLPLSPLLLLPKRPSVRYTLHVLRCPRQDPPLVPP